ncbi:hypothetical protein TWF481_001508 [Arthrobotrys musiformis]|uniref:Uncharacterized protein n=1 Tax=Arthrobotrys musiformis TaxID=47236 RepID=A0AAV9WWU4_9PEZI
MPCAGPYLPDKIYLSNPPNTSPRTKYFLHHGWPPQIASRLASNPRNYQNWLRAYEKRPFICREREFMGKSDILGLRAKMRMLRARAIWESYRQ